MDDIRQLKSVPLFQDLSADELAPLAAKLRRVDFKKGATIVAQNEPGGGLFIITRGRVKVVVPGPKGKDVILDIMGEKEFFGEMSLLDGEPRSATVGAQTPVQVLALDRADFVEWLEARPKICMRMLAEMSRRLRDAGARYSSLANLDVTGRIVRVLVQLGEKQGELIENGGTLIRRSPNHSEIASMAGTTRETVARTLSDFKSRGLVRTDQRGLILLAGYELREALLP